MKKLIHLQPFIPHYREEFFDLLGKRLKQGAVNDISLDQEIYTYEKAKDVKSASFQMSHIVCKHLPSKLIKGKLLFYNPFSLLGKENKVLVLMLHFAHLGTWILLLTKWLHHKKIILWGQGISVRRYLQEEKKPDWKLKWMIALADGIWFYMDKEKDQWQKNFPDKTMVALCNTLSGVDEMTTYQPDLTKDELKAKYGVKQDVIFIFCARFTADRRVDLLLETIKRLDDKKYGFVIIGSGKCKPDFFLMAMCMILELYMIRRLKENSLLYQMYIFSQVGLGCPSLKLWRMVSLSLLLSVLMRRCNVWNTRIFNQEKMD